jgi:hypothetical protein
MKINWGRGKFFALSINLFCLSLDIVASRPPIEESAGVCQDYLYDRALRTSEQDTSSYDFMPLKTFFLGQRDPFLWFTWWVADKKVGMEFTPGLLRLVDTAGLAVEEILKEIPEARVAPSPQHLVGDIQDGYKETMRMVLEGKHEYIRNAVLVRNNIATVVPLLKRVSKKDSKTGLPSYIPIVIKGHQMLEEWDVFAASFWLGLSSHLSGNFLKRL